MTRGWCGGTRRLLFAGVGRNKARYAIFWVDLCRKTAGAQDERRADEELSCTLSHSPSKRRRRPLRQTRAGGGATKLPRFLDSPCDG